MPTFEVRLMNGEPLRQAAHHYEVDDEKGQIVFYKTESEINRDMILFKHGVISITLLHPTPFIPPVVIE